MKLIHALQDRDDLNSLSARFRRARSARVLSLIRTIYRASGACRIIDLGGEPNYWRVFDANELRANGVQITLVNPAAQVVDDPMFDSLAGDACALPQFADGAFDLAHSNSVIEHVGDWPRVEAFAHELRRLAPRYYVQTPYFGFPIEPHFSTPFFHWRSEQARAKRLMARRYGFCERQPDMGAAMRAVQSARLLDKAQFRFLFPDAVHVDERVLGLTKSLVAFRDGYV
jgi:hypothetical protein